jgi:thioredoxin 1
MASGTQQTTTRGFGFRGKQMRAMKSLAIVLAALLAATALMAAENEPIFEEKADAHQQISAALKSAAKDGKNVILDFGANWCEDCHVLETQMHKPELAALIKKSFVVVNVDVGRFDKNLDLATQYHIPLNKGIPAVAVLGPRGELLYAQDQGQFEDARHMTAEAIMSFFEKWKPGK